MDFNSPTYLVDLLIALTEARIRFIVAGGVAIVLHGVERMTLDLDIALAEERENLERFLKFASENGLVPRAPIPAEVLLDSSALIRLVREKGAIVLTFWHPNYQWVQIDVFLKPELSYGSLQTDSVSMMVRDTPIDLASVERIIELKLAVNPPRDKDLADISALRRIQSK